MDINRFYSHPVVVASEIFAAGWCNLNCKYCYIPKTDFLKKIHKSILERIEDGTLLEELKNTYGENLTSISHWGTEPTLTVGKFKKFYSDAIEVFPKLEKVMLSSNFMTNPNNLIKFVTEILPTNKSLTVDIQVSLDGPPEITDNNRLGGASDIIMKNCLTITKAIADAGTVHRVEMHLKPTISYEVLEFLADIKNLEYYYDFFDDFMLNWLQAGNNKIRIVRNCDPTVAIPHNYTQEDGINFYKIVLGQVELQNKKFKAIEPPECNYYGRFLRILRFRREFFTKQKMFTCSAGDSCMAIGDKKNSLHSCHRTFYADHDEYINAAKEHGLEDEIMIGLEKGTNDILVETNVVFTDDEYNLIRSLYTNRAYHDFSAHRISTYIAFIKELVDVSQISDCYKDESLAFLLGIILQTMECPMDNVVAHGSDVVPTLGILRLLGNGAFENILSRILKDSRYI